MITMGLLCLGAFTLVWIIAVWRDFYALVDAAWAFSFPLLAWGWAWGHQTLREPQAVLWCVMMSLWGGRLGLHLTRRLRRESTEDGRYLALRREYGSRVKMRFLFFFWLQGLSVWFLGMPGWKLLSESPVTRFGMTSALGICVFLVGWVGESIADGQLLRFKLDPSNRGKVCDVGLWSRSRHPNYFFEWVIWVGFALFATPSAAPVWGWLSALVMFLLLTRVTGVPMAEAQSLQSKGDAYRQYQARVPKFFPRLFRSA